VPDIAVVIGNYQGEAVLADCLASLKAQTVRPSEVIVVDASSTDRSGAIVAQAGATFLTRENRGLGYLYNEGARNTTAELVLLANNDVALDARCLELLALALAEDARRFAADPRQLSWDGGTLVHARCVVRRGSLFRELMPGYHIDLTVPSSGTVATLCANGATMLVRRERMLELGGFDETFFMDFEDVDLCWRAWLRGWPSVYVPAAFVRHRVGAVTSDAVVPTRLRSSHHNLLRFALKCWPPGDAARVAAGEIARLPAHPTLIGPALWQVARELPEIVALRRATKPRSDFMRWALAGMPEDGQPTA
jgi:N-acetylglucosaminyl-diphospho-decaprenol L-rhamnosyltransferase